MLNLLPELNAYNKRKGQTIINPEPIKLSLRIQDILFIQLRENYPVCSIRQFFNLN